MKKNMGTFDRLTRIIIAMVLAVLWYQHIVTGIPGTILLAIACIFLLTSVVGTCPLYSLFGLRTCSNKKAV